MSKISRKLIVQMALIGLTVLVFVFGGLFINSTIDNNRLKEQITVLQEANESLTSAKVENFVILTFVDEDGAIKTFFVDKTMELSIYDFLLTQPGFTIDDFQTYDQTNYYFANAMTDVLELVDNPDYYVTDVWDGVEYTSLIVGLQAIIINQNLTVVKSGF